MYKIDIIIFFCIIEIIRLAETTNPVEVQSLSDIGPDEAAPLVIFKAGEDKKLYLPTSLLNASFKDGKMINETKFAFLAKTDQMFFCPDENNADKKCLIRKTFEGTDRLRCAKEAPLVIESENLQCGDKETDIFYKIIYQICESDVQQFEFGSNEVQFYRICYDKIMQRTLFTIHIIISPELFKEESLIKEREVVYRMIEKDEFPVFQTGGPDDMEIQEDPISKAQGVDAMEVDAESISSNQTTKPGYEWRKLVPSEDMALALWRKTTFQRANTALQHKNLINLWDKITEHIRSNALTDFKENKLKTFVYTGVFDLYPAQEDDDQLSNVWVKLVITTRFRSSHVDIRKATHGLAILMNNFIDTEANHKTYSNLKIFEEYCGENLCIDTLSDEFQRIKGYIHCCVITEKILNLFQEKYIEVLELHIPNVNVTEDQGSYIDSRQLKSNYLALAL